MTGFGIAVLLMNVLIRVLTSNYERYEDQSVGQFYRARVNMFVEIQSLVAVCAISNIRDPIN